MGKPPMKRAHTFSGTPQNQMPRTASKGSPNLKKTSSRGSPLTKANTVGHNSLQKTKSKTRMTAADREAHMENLIGGCPKRQLLVTLCQRHAVDERTIEWFMTGTLDMVEKLLFKAKEVDKRADTAGCVKNPSAWLTKYFNTINGERDAKQEL